MGAVLLVEDDMLQRMALCADMEDAGFECIEAPDAATALLALGGDREVSLVVADLNLGAGLDGIDVAELMREKQPDLAIIFVTGTPEQLAGRTPQGREAYLAKPYRPAELVAMIRQML